jgi:hypothetical protein
MPAETEPETETETEGGGAFPALAEIGVNPLVLTGMNQPLWLQNSPYPAALDRLLIAAALETGVQGLNELVVSQRAAGANYSVDVAAGRVVVPITDAPNLGSALCTSTAVNNLTVSGAPGAGLNRIDLVIARVYDASVIGGSINGWQLEVVTGTPAASPAVPALPTSSVELARIAVAAGQASVQTVNITDRRVIPGVWRSYTPAWTASLANQPAVGVGGSIIGRYMVRGKTCSMIARLNIGTSGFSGGNGPLSLSTPPNLPALNPLNGASIGTGLLFTPAGGQVWSGIAMLLDVTRVGLVLPYNKTPAGAASEFFGNYWQMTDGTNAANQGVPNMSPAFNVQANGFAWVGITYETT